MPTLIPGSSGSRDLLCVIITLYNVTCSHFQQLNELNEIMLILWVVIPMLIPGKWELSIVGFLNSNNILTTDICKCYLIC